MTSPTRSPPSWTSSPPTPSSSPAWMPAMPIITPQSAPGWPSCPARSPPSAVSWKSTLPRSPGSPHPARPARTRRLPPDRTGVVEAGGRRPAGTHRPAAGLGRAGLPARLRPPGRRPRPLLARPRPVPVRPRHRFRAVVGAVPAARPQPRPAVRPGRIPGPHPARPGRPAPRPRPTAAATRAAPHQPAASPGAGHDRRDAPPGPGLRRARMAGLPLPAGPEDPGHPARLPGRHHRPRSDHRLVRPPPRLEPRDRHRRPRPDVLDVDQHGPTGNGYAAFRQLRNAGLLAGGRAYVRTPSGGLHAYFTGSDQRNGHLPGCHLDFRSRGGYILTPPSQVDGKPYQLVKTLGRPTAPWTGTPSSGTCTPSASPNSPAPSARPPGPQRPGPVGRQPGRRQPQRRPVLGRQPRPGRRPGRRPQPPGRRRPPRRPGRAGDHPNARFRPQTRPDPPARTRLPGRSR